MESPVTYKEKKRKCSISRFSCCGQFQFYIKQITVLLKANSEKKTLVINKYNI
jgi:hypothetical protein